MKFLILTHTPHKRKENLLLAYEPYIREMNLWAKYVEEIIILAPVSKLDVRKIESEYIHNNIKLIPIPSFNILSLKELVLSIVKIPYIFFLMMRYMSISDHVHIRCPGNIGLVACMAQVFFPKKKKTVKYAGNWDPKSLQPLTYKIQKKILSNEFFSRNIKVLVYGKWKLQTKNIVPFFTASYTEIDKENIASKALDNKIKLLFVGTLSKGKQPLLSVKVAHKLIMKGFDVELNIYGDGKERIFLEQYISDNKISDKVILHGNRQKDEVKEAYKQSHFLVFISKSEGWPKVVAEAMFWKCLPISTSVSCVPYMLGNGDRGNIVMPDINSIASIIEAYIKNKGEYNKKVEEACSWSRGYTLDRFELEIKKLLIEN